MKISEASQERLEQLWIITEENNGNETFSPLAGDDELIQMGFVNQNADDCMSLTPEGKKAAADAIRRHRLAERLLTDILAADEAFVDDQACSLEHVLFDGLDESICTLLGHPQYCPHGKRIPPGKCCEQLRTTVKRVIAPLCDLKPGHKGKIAYIQMHDAQRLQKVMALGVLPGVSVRMIRDFPSFVFEAGYSQFAVDTDIASQIYVRLID